MIDTGKVPGEFVGDLELDEHKLLEGLAQARKDLTYDLGLVKLQSDRLTASLYTMGSIEHLADPSQVTDQTRAMARGAIYQLGQLEIDKGRLLGRLQVVQERADQVLSVVKDRLKIPQVGVPVQIVDGKVYVTGGSDTTPQPR